MRWPGPAATGAAPRGAGTGPAGGVGLGVLDKRSEQLQFQRHAESVAVIRYHRALILEMLGEPELAEQDLQRVVELGFEPGDDLF